MIYLSIVTGVGLTGIFYLIDDYNILLICSIEQQYPSNNKWETFSE